MWNKFFVFCTRVNHYIENPYTKYELNILYVSKVTTLKWKICANRRETNPDRICYKACLVYFVPTQSVLEVRSSNFWTPCIHKLTSFLKKHIKSTARERATLGGDKVTRTLRNTVIVLFYSYVYCTSYLIDSECLLSPQQINILPHILA